MKIIVFGATGRVGRCVVAQALESGHQVTAFVRDPRKLQAAGSISIATGDVRDSASVRSALQPGFEAVVVCIGEGALRKSTIVTEGVRRIIEGMKERSIERYLGVSGTAEMPRKTFFGSVSTALMKATPVGHAVRDHDGAFKQVANSGLKWVLAGCPYIKDGPRRGDYRTSLVYSGGFKIIHPPDVADFLLRELREERCTGNIVGIWY